MIQSAAIIGGETLEVGILRAGVAQVFTFPRCPPGEKDPPPGWEQRCALEALRLAGVKAEPLRQATPQTAALVGKTEDDLR